MSSQIFRLFSKNCFRPNLIRKIATVSNNESRRWFEISFADGSTGIFPYVWLRDTSLDPSTYSVSDSMKARRLMMRDFDAEVSPLNFEHDKNENVLKVVWPGKVESIYPAKWLKMRNPSCEKVKKQRRKIYLMDVRPWNAAGIKKRLKKFDHQEFLHDDKVLHDFLSAVCEDGIAILTNGPKRDGKTVENIGERIGLIHQTHFGKVFEVTTKADASNMAYASGDELPYHTDFPSLSQPPELQMLYMYQKAAKGGLSMFVDGFQIAEMLRMNYPDAFYALTTTTLEYIEEGYDIHERSGKDFKFDFNMKARHKVIRCDDNGHVNKIQFGNAMRSWFYDTKPEQIQEVYRALKLFTEFCYDPENQLIFQLEDGETVLWANTRLLHARSAYLCTPEQTRSIHGCYFMWDIVKSRVRHIRQKLQLPEHQDAL
uniref:Gamma-butyrobetaine dioxygenase n=1 Tax=Panagrolaimus sp. JU765 TaxID=591449 RepID=A0AC34RBP5_9BILA